MIATNANEERPMMTAVREPEPAQAQPDMERIFRENSSRVLAAAYRVTGNSQDAEDVLQTVFLRLVRRSSGAPLGDNPTYYLQRAAINAGVDVLRSRKSARQTPLDDVEPILADNGTQAPDRVQASGELVERIREQLSTQSPRSAEIFALRYFEGYDNHEIAKMLGTSRSTVAVILHRTRNHLRESIRDYVGE
jgi:RNA polymerase sigma factor (sigma-70 family)